MAVAVMSDLSIPDEAKAVIWRIFGSGESPLNKKSTYDLVEPIIRKRAASTDSDRVIGEIHGWFESHGGRRWLRSEMSEAVAHLILEGIGSEREETAVWAVGSIEAVLAGRIIHSIWSPDMIDSFVESALKALQTLCDRDAVLDANRIVKAGSGRGKDSERCCGAKREVGNLSASRQPWARPSPTGDYTLWQVISSNS